MPKRLFLGDAAVHSLDKYITNILKGKVLFTFFYTMMLINIWIKIQKNTSTTIRVPQPVTPLRERLAYGFCGLLSP